MSRAAGLDVTSSVTSSALKQTCGQRVRSEVELWKEKGYPSSVNPFLCTYNGSLRKVIKCAHWEVCFSLSFQGRGCLQKWAAD